MGRQDHPRSIGEKVVITLKTQPTEKTWRPVTFGDGQTLEIEIDPPLWGDVIAERTAMSMAVDPWAASCDARLSRITGWRGLVEQVNDVEQPVPFSTGALLRLFRQHPTSVLACLAAVNSVWIGDAETREKN